MRRFLSVILPLGIVVALMLSSCRDEAVYYVKKVNIAIDLPIVSAGYAEISFKPSKETYYICDIMEKIDGYDPIYHQQQFMKLAVDSAYVAYVQWRYQFLKQGEDHVAEFSSHSLTYGDKTNKYVALEPETTYWVYAFVVDPRTNAPVGDLYLREFTTTSMKEVQVTFDARVNGTWLYVYPYDNSGKVTSLTPYVWLCLRDEYYDELGGNARKIINDLYDPYIHNRFQTDSFYSLFCFGVDAFNNEGHMRQGETYHILISSVDGGVGKVVHFKFIYESDGMDLHLTEAKDNIPDD